VRQAAGLGYVDHPPLSIALLAALRAVAGDSLVVASCAVAAGSLLVFVSAALARAMGGGRWAQVVTAVTLGMAPIVLSATHTYSMNAFDLVFWALASLLALRAFAHGGARAWLALGAVLGLGLLGKWSVAWLGAGLAVALVASPARRQLLTPWPYLAALLAGAIVAPNLVWETRNGWPTLEFMRNASSHKMQPLDLAGLLGAQLLVLGPGAALIWVVGFVVALRRSAWRPLAIVWLVTLALLVANGSARAGYLALAALPLFAAGAVWWEERGRVARGAVARSIALSAAAAVRPARPARGAVRRVPAGARPRAEVRGAPCHGAAAAALRRHVRMARAGGLRGARDGVACAGRTRGRDRARGQLRRGGRDRTVRRGPLARRFVRAQQLGLLGRGVGRAGRHHRRRGQFRRGAPVRIRRGGRACRPFAGDAVRAALADSRRAGIPWRRA
jgi:hypothetical protein